MAFPLRQRRRPSDMCKYPLHTSFVKGCFALNLNKIMFQSWQQSASFATLHAYLLSACVADNYASFDAFVCLMNASAPPLRRRRAHCERSLHSRTTSTNIESTSQISTVSDMYATPKSQPPKHACHVALASSRVHQRIITFFLLPSWDAVAVAPHRRDMSL